MVRKENNERRIRSKTPRSTKLPTIEEEESIDDMSCKKYDALQDNPEYEVLNDSQV